MVLCKRIASAGTPLRLTLLSRLNLEWSRPIAEETRGPAQTMELIDQNSHDDSAFWSERGFRSDQSDLSFSGHGFDGGGVEERCIDKNV